MDNKLLNSITQVESKGHASGEGCYSPVYGTGGITHYICNGVGYGEMPWLEEKISGIVGCSVDPGWAKNESNSGCSGMGCGSAEGSCTEAGHEYCY